MWISEVKLDNYVSFYKTPPFEFGRGINFVVGKNNSGKTALLDALNLDQSRDSHRSVETIPNRNVQSSGEMEIEFQIAFKPAELLDITRQFGSVHWIPIEQVTNPNSALIREIVRQTVYEESRFRFSAFPLQFSIGTARTNISISRLSNIYSSSGSHAWFPLGDDDFLPMDEVDTRGIREDRPTLLNIWFEHCRSNIYKFDAQRITAPHTATTNELLLKPDGSNLAQVLDTAVRLKTFKCQKLIELVKTVFDSVQEVIPLKLSDKEEKEYLEVYIGYFPPELQREDLRIPLSGCGTGLAQVIAMLYVVVMSEHSQIILIDEPQSFLHPDALRNLLAIFQLPEYAHHQYILATHSPTAIASVKDKHIVLLNRKEMKSTITTIDQTKSADIEVFLRSVGARLSDVFGMDNIIWVEGVTDEICFRMILRANGIPLFGTKILGVERTGDFISEDHGAAAVKLYKRLSGGDGLMPPALAFIFDADMEKKLQAVRAELSNLVKLLPRQNYECYLIEPTILAEILNRDGVEEKRGHSPETVSDWIRQNNEGYDYDDSEWLATVDGKNFLNKVFDCLGGISYKDHTAAYGGEITKRILEECPNHFQEIVDLIKSILPDAAI